MKLNSVPSLLAVIISALLGYAVYSIADIDPNAILAGIVSTVCFIVTLTLAIGVEFTNGKLSVNIRVLSLSAFTVMLISHFAFAATIVKMPYYLIVNGLILCIYLCIAYYVNSLKRY